MEGPWESSLIAADGAYWWVGRVLNIWEKQDRFLVPLPGSRWSASDSQFVIFGLLGLRSYLLCALRCAVQPHGRVNNTVWFLLSTDCSWNVPQLSGNRLILRFQHADAREFPSAHLPRQRAGLRVGPALGTAAKLDCAWITSLYALRQIRKNTSRTSERK